MTTGCFPLRGTGRSPKHHPVFCIWAHLVIANCARLETKIALTLLLERFHDIQRVREMALERVNSPVMYGVKQLPITFRRS